MGIFTRFRDIISSNVNAMLDQAEDPEKMITLMIQEMEDTLVELKASCAGAIASRARVQRALDDAKERAEGWEAKAKLALDKGREELAREALVEKRNFIEQAESLEANAGEMAEVVEQYQQDIGQLEEKLETMRKKLQVLVQRHIQARKSKRARTQVRKAEGANAFVRFEQMLHRVDRMAAEADLVRVRKASLEKEFEALETDEGIEAELAALKKKSARKEPVAESAEKKS